MMLTTRHVKYLSTQYSSLGRGGPVLDPQVVSAASQLCDSAAPPGSRPPLCWRDCVEQREDAHAGHELLQLFCLSAALLDDPAQVEEQLKALQEEERAHPPAARAPEGPARRRAVSSGSGCPRSRCQPPVSIHGAQCQRGDGFDPGDEPHGQVEVLHIPHDGLVPLHASRQKPGERQVTHHMELAMLKK